MRACDIAPAAEGATDRLAAIDPFSGLGTESWLSATEGRTHEAAGGLRNCSLASLSRFRLATAAYAPQGAILFDKLHVMRHLGEALDHVRKREYGRLAGRDRRYIKGQKYTLLSRKENLTLDGRKALKALLSANKRLNTAYVLKESFGQLWSYEREGWARRFFENWRASLKWQRLKPYEKFAEMIDRPPAREDRVRNRFGDRMGLERAVRGIRSRHALCGAQPG
jgi:hypothetical protein